MNLQERVIIITGASRGIGAATARAFADYPVRLALWARAVAPLQALAEELNARPGVQATPMIVDVSQSQHVHEAAAQTEARFGRVDILVNNAGVGMRAGVEEVDLALAQQVFAVNYWGALSCIQAVLPGMKARGDGLILNISSIIGRRALPRSAIYCGSKFALNALSEAMRVELQPYNVRVVSFYPGVTRTDFTRNELTGDASRRRRGLMPQSSAERVGRAIVRAAQREPRSAYATLFDRLFVMGSVVAPGLMDWLLARAL